MSNARLNITGDAKSLESQQRRLVESHRDVVQGHAWTAAYFARSNLERGNLERAEYFVSLAIRLKAHCAAIEREICHES